jgi:hypothetical protein
MQAVPVPVSNVPVRYEKQRQSRVLHSHSTVSGVVVESTWEGAEYNAIPFCPFVGLERTKPHVFYQEKWPAGSYTTGVASGRALLCFVNSFIQNLPPPVNPSTCIKIMVHQDTWQALFFCKVKRSIT